MSSFPLSSQCYYQLCSCLFKRPFRSRSQPNIRQDKRIFWTEYFIGRSLHNMVTCFYYATSNWATCFDPPGPSSACTILCKDGPIKYSITRAHNRMETTQFRTFWSLKWVWCHTGNKRVHFWTLGISCRIIHSSNTTIVGRVAQSV